MHAKYQNQFFLSDCTSTFAIIEYYHRKQASRQTKNQKVPQSSVPKKVDNMLTRTVTTSTKGYGR
jgi:hypothetical protein